MDQQANSQGLNPENEQKKSIVLSPSLKQLLTTDKFVELCEIHAPTGQQHHRFCHDAQMLKPYFDAMVVTGQIKDRPVLSSSRAAGLLREKQIESIAVLSGQSCSEKNLHQAINAICGRGIRSVVCLSGDPLANEQKNLGSLKMLQIASDKNEAGNRLLLGSVMDPFLQPMDHAMTCLKQKIQVGAGFVLTQMVFDFLRFHTFCKAMSRTELDPKAAVIAGIPVVVSERGLALAKRLPGVQMPQKIQEQLCNAPDITACGIAMAQQMIHQIRQISGIRGVCLMLLGGRDYQPLIDVIHNPL